MFSDVRSTLNTILSPGILLVNQIKKSYVVLIALLSTCVIISSGNKSARLAGESSDMNNYTLGDRPTDTPLAYLERQNQFTRFVVKYERCTVTSTKTTCKFTGKLC